MNIVLLGDSILDNGAYVGGGTDVAGHLRLLAARGTTVTLCAVDGSTTADVPSQIRCIPQEATHLVLSAGGNDALAHAHVLTRAPTTAIDVLKYLAAAVEHFALQYRAAVRSLHALGKPLLLCTVYNGNLPPEIAIAARAAIAVFNDKIYHIAGEMSLPVLELRRVCSQPSDYANPIEPSSSGGKKIAAAILDSLGRQNPLETCRSH